MQYGILLWFPFVFPVSETEHLSHRFKNHLYFRFCKLFLLSTFLLGCSFFFFPYQFLGGLNVYGGRLALCCDVSGGIRPCLLRSHMYSFVSKLGSIPSLICLAWDFLSLLLFCVNFKSSFLSFFSMKSYGRILI